LELFAILANLAENTAEILPPPIFPEGLLTLLL
jgi:hypothetical protein